MTTSDNRALWELVEKYDARMHEIGGCTDGSCVIEKRKGMHTNGGCRCSRDYLKMQRAIHAANALRKDVAAILERAVVVGDEDVERARKAYRAIKRYHTADYPEPIGSIRSVADINRNDDDAWRAALESMVRGGKS